MPARLNRWACRPVNAWPSIASDGMARPRASTAAWNSAAVSARLELISSRWSSVSGVPGVPIALYLPTANTSTLSPRVSSAAESSTTTCITPMDPTRAEGVA